MPRRLLVEADGGSRGNPGIAAGGAVIVDIDTGELLAELGAFVGIATNNIAEYRGMVEGIRRAFMIDPAAVVHVRMDSKLVVEQMSRRWRIRHSGMQAIAAEARGLIGNRTVTFEWVPRLQNARADALANRAMDLKASFGL